MFPIYPEFRQLKVEEKDDYNHFFLQHELPCSDYCFSVVQTWLAYGGPVEVSQLNDKLILVKYRDVLDNSEPEFSYAAIGASGAVDQAVVDILCSLSKEPHSKVIITAPHKAAVEKHLPKNAKLVGDRGLDDYVYSVDDYATLDKPDYRRVRREISLFHREYNDSFHVKELSLESDNSRMAVINNHHIWDKTFQFQNDPLRVEGLIISRIVELAPQLDVRCVMCLYDETPQGVLIFTELKMKEGSFINLHHARFSYNYRYMNDYAFHLLAKHLQPEGIQFINFERDADIPGLRHHKELLKPVKMIHNFDLVVS